MGKFVMKKTATGVKFDLKAGNGEVIGCTPLTQETSFTEWIGGVIVLSPFSEMESTEDFQAIIGKVAHGEESPLYAWHISHFDFSKEELTPQSRVRRL